MMRSMFAGVSGLKAHQTRMDVIGNNIANVNTIGFKGSRVTFMDTLNQTLRLASGPQAGRGGINPAQVGLGVSIASIDVLQTQGNLQNTGNVTDLAIQGEGFFVVGDGIRQFYTRAGMFSLERDGRLVLPSNGLAVQGWMANDGMIDTTARLTSITLPVGQTIPPITTDNVAFQYNLDSRNNGALSLGPNPQTILDAGNHSSRLSFTLEPTGNFNEFTYTATVTDGAITDSSGVVLTNADGSPLTKVTGRIVMNSDGTVQNIIGGDFYIKSNETGASAVCVTVPAVNSAPDFTCADNGETFTGTYKAPTNPAVTSRIIDSLGQAHTVYTTFTKTGNNSWDWVAKDETGNTTYGSGSLTFDSTGKMTSSVGGPIAINVPGASAISIIPDFNALTQYASDTNIASSSNGYPMGQLESFNIDSSGKIIGVFSNGLTQTLAQVAMANFRNPSGLTRSGDTMFSESNNSGVAQIGSAGMNGRGQITPGAIEMSNVDLSQEFTDMITTERGFQANSRIITTSDEMLQDLVNLKR
jgi:flagellar hook protein FlgE